VTPPDRARRPASDPDAETADLQAAAPLAETRAEGRAEAERAGAPPERVGAFQIEGELGRGGMGVVYRARHPELERAVALKVVSSGRATPEERARFKREARLAARLRHPGIVGVHDVGEEVGSPWIAMDLIDGPALDDRVRREGPLSPSRAGRVGVELAEALAYAHAQGVLHRDLKPGNVLLDADGRAVLTDFGLAKDTGAGDEGLTRSGLALGTPAYMPPEQASGEPLDHRADVYGLGATLYELLTGAPPFAGESARAVLTAVLHEDPPRPRARRPELPADLETIVLRCLEKEPAFRYPTARAVADDLRRFLADEPIAARRPGPTERLRKWARRHPGPARLVAGVAGAFTALLVGSSLLWTARVGEEAERTREALRRAEAQRALAESRGRELEGERRAAEAARAEAVAAAERARAELARAERMLGVALAERGRGAGLEHQRAAVLLAAACVRDDRPAWRARAVAAADAAWRGLALPVGPEAHQLAWGPDGARLATGGADGSLRVWDARDGALRWRREGAHRGVVSEVVWGPAGERLATIGTDERARVWTPGSPEPVHELPAVSYLARWSPGADRLATYVRRSGALVVATPGGARRELLAVTAGAPRWSPDGRHVAVAVTPSVLVLDAAAGERVLELAVEDGGRLFSAWSPDGRTVATLEGDAVVLTGVPGGEQRRIAAPSPFFVYWSPLGDRIAVTGDGTRVYDVASGREVAAWAGQLRTWSSDGAWAGVTEGRQLVVRDARSGAVATVLAGRGQLGARPLAWSPRGVALATAGLDRVVVWRPNPPLSATRRLPSQAAWSPVGSALAVVEGGRADVRTPAGEVVARAARPARVTALAWAPDGARLALAGPERLWVWRWREGALRNLAPADGPVEHLAWSGDGRRLAVRRELEVAVLTVSDGRATHAERASGGRVRWAPGGARLAYVWGRDLELWTEADGTRTTGLPSYLFAFGPRGDLAGADSESSVALWREGAEPAAARLERGEPVDLAVGPDGTVAVASSAEAVFLLAPDTLEPAGELAVGGRARAVAWSPDGGLLAVAVGEAVQLWDVARGEVARERVVGATSVSELSWSADGRWLLGRPPIDSLPAVVVARDDPTDALSPAELLAVAEARTGFAVDGLEARLAPAEAR